MSDVSTKYGLVYLGKPAKVFKDTIDFTKPALNIAGWKDSMEEAEQFAKDFPINFHSIVTVNFTVDKKKEDQ